MATRFYLPSTGTPAVTPAASAFWTVVSAFVYPMSTSKTSTAVANRSATETDTTNNISIRALNYVSAPIAAGAISGTFSLVIKFLESSTSANASLQCLIRVMSADGQTERGVLYGGHSAANNATAGALGEEASTSQTTRIMNAVALSSVTAQAGDRIVVGIGGRMNNASATSFSVTFNPQDDQATDLALTSGLTTTENPWLEFSQTISFDVTAPTVPTALAVTAFAATTVDLSWTASTDAVGVVGYKIYKDAVFLANQTSGVTYQATGLTAATSYTFTVSAYDAAGNESAQTSGVAQVTATPTTVTPAVVAATTTVGAPTVSGGTSASAGTRRNALQEEMNRLANGGTYRAAGAEVACTLAANQYAGTTGLALVGALNAKNGSSGIPLQGVLNALAGTTGLGPVEAARQCTG